MKDQLDVTCYFYFTSYVIFHSSTITMTHSPINIRFRAKSQLAIWKGEKHIYLKP